MSIRISVNRTIPNGSGWVHEKIAIVKSSGVSHGNVTLESIVSDWTTDKSSKFSGGKGKIDHLRSSGVLLPTQWIYAFTQLGSIIDIHLVSKITCISFM